MGFENGHLLRCTFRASDGSHEQVTTVHYDLDNASPLLPNDPQSLADTLADDLLGLFASFLPSSWTLDPVVVADEVDPLNPLNPRSAWTGGDPTVGTQGGVGDLLPPGTAPVCTWRTAHIGRRFRGRSFFIMLPDEGAQGNGIWVSSVQARLQAIADAFPRQPDISGPGSDSTAKLCVYSRTQRAANLDPYASAVTSGVVRTRTHFLRRRADY